MAAIRGRRDAPVTVQCLRPVSDAPCRRSARLTANCGRAIGCPSQHGAIPVHDEAAHTEQEYGKDSAQALRGNRSHDGRADGRTGNGNPRKEQRSAPRNGDVSGVSGQAAGAVHVDDEERGADRRSHRDPAPEHERGTQEAPSDTHHPGEQAHPGRHRWRRTICRSAAARSSQATPAPSSSGRFGVEPRPGGFARGRSMSVADVSITTARIAELDLAGEV